MCLEAPMKVIGIGGDTGHCVTRGVERDVGDKSGTRRDNPALARQTAVLGYWR